MTKNQSYIPSVDYFPSSRSFREFWNETLGDEYEEIILRSEKGSMLSEWSVLVLKKFFLFSKVYPIWFCFDFRCFAVSILQVGVRLGFLFDDFLVCPQLAGEVSSLFTCEPEAREGISLFCWCVLYVFSLSSTVL